MLENSQAGELQSWDGSFSLDVSVNWINEVFFVLLQKAETSDDNDVDHGQSANLLDLIDKPGDGESNEYQERVPCLHDDDSKVDCVEEDEDEQETDGHLICQQEAALLGIVFVNFHFLQINACKIP